MTIAPQVFEREPTRPRITPGGRADIGRVNALIAAAIGRATGGPPPRIFTTLGRHRKLFRAWLRFAGALMPRGKLPRQDTELVILRVAHNCGCDYEWRHHEHIAQVEGLTAADVFNAKQGSSAFAGHQALLIRAADELHEHRTIGDGLWSELARHYSDVELIELCMLIGHYEMLAMTLNSLGVQPDQPPNPRRLALLRRRRAKAANRRDR